jgi:hypothetical protein
LSPKGFAASIACVYTPYPVFFSGNTYGRINEQSFLPKVVCTATVGCFLRIATDGAAQQYSAFFDLCGSGKMQQRCSKKRAYSFIHKQLI